MAAISRMKGRKPIKIPLHSVIDVLKNVQALGHEGGLKKAAKKSKAFITLHPKTVNLIKAYMADNNLHEANAVAKKIVGACPGPDPYKCPFAVK